MNSGHSLSNTDVESVDRVRDGNRWPGADKQVESCRQGEHCSECPLNRWNMHRVAERNKFVAGDKEHATQDVLNWWNQNCAAKQDEFGTGHVEKAAQNVLD